MMSEPMATDSEYTIEDFLDGRIYVQCDNEEERDRLRILSGWNGRNDALEGKNLPALYRHDKDDYDGERYGYTFFSHIGSPFFKELPVVAFEDLKEAMPDGVRFDNCAFMAMLGCGGDG